MFMQSYLCTFAGSGKKLLRLVGCCKEDTKDTLLPFVPSASAIKQHPLHHHIFTFLTGDEQDVTDLIPVPDARPTQRQRLEPHAVNQDANRSFSVAPWLDQAKEMEYKVLAHQLLADRGISSGYDMGRLKGNHFYASTNRSTGRNCCYGGERHQNNNFFVSLERSGAVMYHCYGANCRAQDPIQIGHWESNLQQMLRSPAMFKPGRSIDAVLLRNLEKAAIKATPAKEKMTSQPWYDELEQVVSRYVSHFYTFVSKPSVYVMETRDDEGNVATYTRYDANRLKSVVVPYQWAFGIWNKAHFRQTLATKIKFVGQPWSDRVSPDEYNLCEGMMPLLKEARRELTEADMVELKPILDHIQDSICAGSDEDYGHLMAWLAHIVQDPAEKVGWCPVSTLL